jgi:hypothetical protein
VLAHNICVLVHTIHELGIEPIFCAEIRPTGGLAQEPKLYASFLCNPDFCTRRTFRVKLAKSDSAQKVGRKMAVGERA